MALSFKVVVLLFVLIAFSSKVHAFGAGNIASIARIEGQNWRHGDIEDTLLTLTLARIAGGRKFSKLDVQRVYFGNWLRDYSQAVDVGTLKYVSTEAIRILIWVLGFLSFGYGTKEFEVTTERLGCYEPTEHIDNPMGYAEGDDARNYDDRLRGPVDEERELSIDPRTGLKNYIASENIGIATSAGLVRRVLIGCIQYGRRYASSGDDADLHEALRLLGTGLHCLEDYAAHSNYTELSLIELGESDVFPHVGRNAKVEIEGARDYVYPIVTGTFGGVDFFHSVLGEISDKATQSEVQCLENVMTESQDGPPSDSFIQDLLDKIPEGLIGDSDNQKDKMNEFKAQSQSAKENSANVSPREPEEWTRYLDDVHQQMYPILEWHDDIIKSINKAIEQIPVLPELVEQIQEQITIFVFSILAPYVAPIIGQVKAELQTGSSEVIQSSRTQQHIVFDDDDCSNPTHSMLSKDHFSNILNEPAGKIASQTIKWTVPQIMGCWDNEDIDAERTLDRIISGVFHHPALREYGEDGAADMRQIMFGTVQEWWEQKSGDEQDVLRGQLSRDGVREGLNHKEGVQDCGHGCGKPLTLHKEGRSSSGQTSDPGTSAIGKAAGDAAGGGAIGGLVEGLVSGVGNMLRNDSDSRPERESGDGYAQESRYGGGSGEQNYEYGSYENSGRPQRDDVPRYDGYSNDSRERYGGEEYSSRGEEYGSRGGEYSSRGDEYSSRGDEYSSRGGEYGSRGDEYGSRGDEYSSRQEYSTRGDYEGERYSRNEYSEGQYGYERRYESGSREY